MKIKNFFWCVVFYILFFVSLTISAQEVQKLDHGKNAFIVPKEYLEESEEIPPYWLTTNEEVKEFLDTKVKNGKVEIYGISEGGRAIYAVSYGEPRRWKGTTTFSGSLGFLNEEAYRGPDHEKTVYFGLSGIHGGEFEGIMGTLNLISVIETGKDLDGKEWTEISETIKKLDRIVLVPIANPDGRARVPIRMQKYRGTNNIVHEYLNTGGNPDGSIIGWPMIKEFIPLDFNRPGFPGGYPNDAGVNMMHDDFFGDAQPETKALFNLAEREKPDLVLNMHTGAVYINMQRPFCEQKLDTVWNSLFMRSHKRLALEGLLRTKDVERESDPYKIKAKNYNLNTALNLHCGTLSVTVESTSHGFSSKSGDDIAFYSPKMLLEAQLYLHLEAINFLVESGGRSKWFK